MKQIEEYYKVGETFNRGWTQLKCVEDTSEVSSECDKCFFYNREKLTCVDSAPQCSNRKDKKFVHFEEV